MNPDAIASTYRQASIESAPPAKLVKLLLDGAIRFLDKATQCDPKADPVFRQWARRADAIVCELRVSLDAGPDPALFEQLDGLYEFCEHQISRALLDQSHEPLAAARQVLDALRSAGFSEEELHRIAYRNWIRVLRETWGE